jgi:hypothetical protein
MDTVSAEDVQIHGIVDNTLRVRGIENLRIADASVIPHIPSAPIAATAMALGLAAGQMVNAKITHSMQTSLKSYPVPAATTWSSCKNSGSRDLVDRLNELILLFASDFCLEHGVIKLWS